MSSTVYFGMSKSAAQSGNAAPQYYAFSVSADGHPQVCGFRTDDDGIEALSNLVRAETVMSVVLGIAIPLVEESTVYLGVGRDRVQHRLTVRQ